VTPEQAQALMQQAECLYDRAAVESALDRMASDINARLGDDDVLVLCVVNGGIVVTGALLTRLDFPLQLDHVHATRYRGARSGAALQWRRRPDSSVSGRTVLLVDDILDEGDTLAGIRDWCLQQGAKAVLTAVLVDKQHERRCAALPQADFTGLTTPDRYLFGYGMDCEEYWRNAPGIYAVVD
jgi:hypoxanthine phosphoribosyltransferase